ncbi:hypothetical protein IHE45_13G077100 [Dioscorea alata]|uniref:Uncharacterized protein n=1 Tax=Dioscorea alata TaxID=55571 RepID=A0ACB7UYS4_DIOAL|nr:hypothetical protein IHE45_13G077100 [Dioscorea alata]
MVTSILGIIITIKQVVYKMKRWFIKLNEVVDMMNTSGFGWDDARKYFQLKHPKVENHANKELKEFKILQGAETSIDVVEGLNGNTNNFIENIDSYMFAARSDTSLLVKKMPYPPMARNLGEEVKKLGLSELQKFM